MTYSIPHLQSPELKVSGDKRLVDVPSAQAEESVALYEKEKASGFFFNAYRGSDQAVLNAVLERSRPEIVGISGFGEIDYAAVYKNPAISKLILGDHVPWPDFQRLAGLKAFTALSAEVGLDQLPAGLEALDIYGARIADLTTISRLAKLRRLRLTLADVVELSGLPVGVRELELNHCRKLRSIDAIGRCELLSLVIDQCKKISSLQVLESQEQLEYLMIANMGTIPTTSFTRNMPDLSTFKVIKTVVADGSGHDLAGG